MYDYFSSFQINNSTKKRKEKKRKKEM